MKSITSKNFQMQEANMPKASSGCAITALLRTSITVRWFLRAFDMTLNSLILEDDSALRTLWALGTLSAARMHATVSTLRSRWTAASGGRFRRRQVLQQSPMEWSIDRAPIEGRIDATEAILKDSFQRWSLSSSA